MPDPWMPERGRLFLRELTAQLATSASPNCNDVADAIDMDEHESGELMHWLARESLVCEIGPDEREPVPPFSCDPYTMGPLDLTSRGAYFRDSKELPQA